MTAHDLLSQLDPWLQGRSRYLSAQLPGLGADEIYQQAVEEFLRELDRWMQQDATVSILAQARRLMAFCLAHVRTREIRARQRRYELPDDEDGDPLDRVAEPVTPLDTTSAAEVLAQVRGATTPPCALCVLSLKLPGLVEQDDAARAKSWRKGGSQAVPRPVCEAWELFLDGLSQPSLVADDAAWKDQVGVAWYTEGPVAELTSDARRVAAVKVERYSNRGVEDLRAALMVGDRK
jgi:hypothetical protein